MSTLFISDLHLQDNRPDLSRAFFHFLQHQATTADALYILGDLFDAWLGDDDDSPLARQAIDEIRALTTRGVPVYFMHGNRDFLVGEDFARRTACEILQDPTRIVLYGQPVLLMHGDSLCTGDQEYMAFRQQIRDPQRQAQLLALPLQQRRDMAQQLRQQSKAANASKAADIMDVTETEVFQALAQFQTTLLIHGHTHRPKIHRYNEQQPLTRIVLGDWDQQGWLLRYHPDHSFELESFNLGSE